MCGEVGRGDDVAIAGFVVTGDTPKKFLIRAMGTELKKAALATLWGIRGSKSSIPRAGVRY